MTYEESGGGVFKGNRVEAVYRANEEGMFSHNAFIEALPDLMDDVLIAKKITRRPIWEESQRNWPAKRRLLAVQTIANYVEPLPVHLDLAQRFERMIRNGYVARNPISAEWVKQIRAGYRDLPWDDNNPPIIRSTASGFTVIGASGVGKTTAVESILSLYPQVVVHTKYNDQPFDRTQLVWLKLECPYNGSIKGLCLNFFQAVDEIIGTRYYHKTINSRESTTRQLLPKMANVASVLGLGVLVIDEIQRLSQVKSGGAEEMLDFFVELANKIGVPVVLIGTFKALPLITSQFAQARRSAGQGDLMWTNMVQGDEWDYFIDSLWEYQWTNTPTKLTRGIRKAVYEESQGIIDIAIKLYMLAQWAVIGQESEKITPKSIREVAKQSLSFARPILEALRMNDQKKLSEVSDVYQPIRDFETYLKQAEERVSMEGQINTLRNQQLANKDESGPVIQVAKWLADAGFDNNIAISCAKEVIEKHAKGTDILLAKQEAFILAMKVKADEQRAESEPPPLTGNKGKRSSVKNNTSLNLIELVAKGKEKGMPAYEALREEGIVKPLHEVINLD